MQALTILKQLNATSGRKVPDDAPPGFVPRRAPSGWTMTATW